jgi:hypothetical protein
MKSIGRLKLCLNSQPGALSWNQKRGMGAGEIFNIIFLFCFESIKTLYNNKYQAKGLRPLISPRDHRFSGIAERSARADLRNQEPEESRIMESGRPNLSFKLDRHFFDYFDTQFFVQVFKHTNSD